MGIEPNLAGFKEVGLHYTVLSAGIRVRLPADPDSPGNFLKTCEGWAYHASVALLLAILGYSLAQFTNSAPIR